MQRIYTIAIQIISLCSGVAQAEPSTVYVAQITCGNGPFALHLPRQVPELMKIGTIEQQKVDEIVKLERYSTTYKTVYFHGLTLGLVIASNNPNRYLVSFAEITGAQWSHVAPFRVSESVRSIRNKLGSSSDGDPTLKANYSGDTDSISFEHAEGKITKVTYACYTG